MRDESEWMYKDLLDDALKKGIFSKIFVAYSFRDHKMISDALNEQHKLVWNLLSNQGAPIYMCGGISGFGESVYTAVCFTMSFLFMS